MSVEEAVKRIKDCIANAHDASYKGVWISIADCESLLAAYEEGQKELANRNAQVESLQEIVTAQNKLHEDMETAFTKNDLRITDLEDRHKEVEALLNSYHALYEAVCHWFNYGPPEADESDPPERSSCFTASGEYEPFTKKLSDAVTVIDHLIKPHCSPTSDSHLLDTGDEEDVDYTFPPPRPLKSPVPDTEKVKKDARRVRFLELVLEAAQAWASSDHENRGMREEMLTLAVQDYDDCYWSRLPSPPATNSHE